ILTYHLPSPPPMRLVALLLALLAAPALTAQPMLLASADGDLPLVLAASTEAGDATPGSVTIYTLYPNPTADRSELTFSVERSQDVQVVLYDVLGRKVADLYSGTLDADVTRTVEIDVEAMPVGLYVVRVTGDDFRAVRRLTVVR
ncbi:MAG: T9SS type A sorting domain-containing protein, partial [Bacteroidota bacterium]